MSTQRRRRSLLITGLALAVNGLAGACGVKGPLYLPEEKEKETEEEKKAGQKTSRRRSATPASRLG